MILKDVFTGEQIDMLKSDLSDNDLFTLFLMNEEEKHNFFRNFRSTWLAKYDEYLTRFNYLYEESLKYKDSDKVKYIGYCDRTHSVFLDMDRCMNFVRIYDILLDFI